MSDTNRMILSTLEDIVYSLQLIQRRFELIESSDDFLADEDKLEKLDSISMRLIAIGEGFKNIDKLTDRVLLKEYAQIDWRGVKGIRDILSHHYFDLDAEIIFNICDTQLSELLVVSKNMISILKSNV